MKVEILEDALKTAEFGTLIKGDIKTVPDETGAAWCASGWAADVDGKVVTGQRDTSGASLVVDKAAHGVSSPVVGVK